MGPSISLSFRLYQFDMIPQMTRPLTCFAASFAHGRLENDQLEEFPNVLTNSSGALIGGSCTRGGMVLLLVILYLLYKLYKPYNRIDYYPRCARCGRIRSDSRRMVMEALMRLIWRLKYSLVACFPSGKLFCILIG